MCIRDRYYIIRTPLRYFMSLSNEVIAKITELAVSLGYEMCIRDRHRVGDAHSFPAVDTAGPGANASGTGGVQPVSYTHLRRCHYASRFNIPLPQSNKK